jgi:3-hydroxyacyl-CoA dehydrogenase / enoyl-CoA hydratase / 3-hydroxybutyryl-CoA epimerase / enoyl-CoA isomerase
MVAAERYGQKNGKGFYTWEPQKKGPPKKNVDPFTEELLKAHATGAPEVSDAGVVERMMLPMLLECSRCLEDGIVATPTEVDLALVYGLGFPPFRGGIFRWADATGAPALLTAAEKYAALGALYAPTQQLRDLAAGGKGFHGE